MLAANELWAQFQTLPLNTGLQNVNVKYKHSSTTVKALHHYIALMCRIPASEELSLVEKTNEQGCIFQWRPSQMMEEEKPKQAKSQKQNINSSESCRIDLQEKQSKRRRKNREQDLS